MGRPAWDALESLSTVGRITVELLSAPIVLPESVQSLKAKKATGTYATMGPGRLQHGDDFLPLRTLACDLIGSLTDTTRGEATIHGAALYFSGEVVAVVPWTMVVLSPEKPELTAHMDLSVSAYGGEEP